MNNQYIIDELSKEAAYHLNAYQEKVAALNSIAESEKIAVSANAVDMYNNSAYTQPVSKAAPEMPNPRMIDSIRSYFPNLAQDAKKAYSDIAYYLKSPDYAKSLRAKEIMRALGGFAGQHPFLTAAAAAAPIAAGLGTAYGMGAFGGQQSPEAAGMMQEGMSPEEMMAASEMAKQSSYNPQMYKTAEAVPVGAGNFGSPVMAQGSGVNIDAMGNPDPTLMARLQEFLANAKGSVSDYMSTLGRDMSQAYGDINHAVSGMPFAGYGLRARNIKDAIGTLAKKHPILATGAAVAPIAAGLGTAYGMGAFDGQPSPEEMAAAEMAKQSSYNPNMNKTAGYFSNLAQDARRAYNNAAYAFKNPDYAKSLKVKEIMGALGGFAGEHPWVTAGTAIPAAGMAAAPAALAAAAYGMGAFGGQQSPEAAGMMQEGMSPEEAGMMQGGMSPEEMMAASEMAKQSSYSPNPQANSEKVAAYNNLVATLQQNPEFKQILMNM